MNKDKDLDGVSIVIRDINGKRDTLFFNNVNEFNSKDWTDFDDEENEILMVVWGQYCVFSQLQNNESIVIEDVIGFFA